jgi:hypothetical protein
MGIKSRLKTNKCPIEEITCKINSRKHEISLFGFKTHTTK